MDLIFIYHIGSSELGGCISINGQVYLRFSADWVIFISWNCKSALPESPTLIPEAVPTASHGAVEPLENF